MHQHPKALVFDLGGVLIEVDFVPALEYWSKFSRLTLSEIKTTFKMDEEYCAHERGEISFENYASHLQKVFQLECTVDQIRQGWNSIFGDELSSVLKAIDSVPDEISIAILSNSNRAHQDYWQQRYASMLSRFDRVFVSSEIQCRKPEPECFDYVARELNCAFSEMVFFDDTLENVEGAESIGIESVHVLNPDSVITALMQKNLIAKP